MASFGRGAGIGLALAIMAMLGGAAWAEETKPAPSPLSPDGKDACFGRVYDKAHLKAHPNQKVARIFFYYGHDPVSRPNEEPNSGQSDYTGFMTTTVRGAKKPEWAGGWCGGESEDGSGNIRCGMECDRTMAMLKLEGKDHLIVSGIDADIYLGAGAEDELGTKEYKKQSLGAEDDNFKLDRMPGETCTAEFARIDPIDPSLGAPLRERLKPDQPFCFGRDYDAKHLGSHPDQVTQTIRVFRGPIELASYAATNTPDNWPNGADIVVSVTTRQKSGKVLQTYSCDGEGDQWHCTATTKASDAACDISQKEIYLRRGANGTMMLANPNSGVPIVDLCSKAADGKTKSDDKVYRLDPLPQSACAP